MKYVLVSDIHANKAALDAVLNCISELTLREAPFQIVFLGDLVGYGSMEGALGCLKWLRSHPEIAWVPGNHDEWMVRQVERVHESASLSLQIQRTYLSRPEHIDLLLWFEEHVKQAILKKPVIQINKRQLSLTFTHASLARGAERGSYLYPWVNARIENELHRLANEAQQKSGWLCYGHTHFPALAVLRENSVCFRTIQYGVPIELTEKFIAINPGSVGQPRDGDPRASFAILDTKEHTITFHRVAYDVEDMARQLESDGHFGSRRHLLSLDERDHLKTREGSSIDPASIYKGLIERLRAGNKDANLAYYQGVYRKIEGGLEAVNECNP